MPTPIAYARLLGERDALQNDNARLRSALTAIKQATIDGRVCDDVAWFTEIETLHDFCERVLTYSPDQLQLV